MALNGGLEIRLTTCYIHIASSLKLLLPFELWTLKSYYKNNLATD